MDITPEVIYHIFNRGLESTVDGLDVNGNTVIVEFDDEV